MLIAGEDTHRNWLSARRCFCEHVSCFVEASWDVIELEAIESVLQWSYFLALIDNQLGVALDVEASDAQLDGDS